MTAVKKGQAEIFRATICERFFTFCLTVDDYIQIMRGLEETIKNPNEVRVNNIDASELHYIRELNKNNQIEIVKLNIPNDKEHPNNSILSSWIINNKGLTRINKKTTSIYKKK